MEGSMELDVYTWRTLSRTLGVLLSRCERCYWPEMMAIAGIFTAIYVIRSIERTIFSDVMNLTGFQKSLLIRYLDHHPT
jgi:hypothetical protein